MCTTTRFVFGVESINSLKAEEKDRDYDESSKPLTRYKALAAFIWKHMTPACKMKSNNTRPAVVIHILDRRRRIGGLDFGFGKPLWVGVTRGDKETLPNEVIIMEINEAIQAWLTMEMQHIANLERDIEFLRLALPNPSV
ncbi:hypothetical protein JHK85_007135 [Glycine max]|nr:hypothetical protein JHK85_007135 [Glycine max]KAG5071731.1 hypothetical protein JHK86_006942 [Glycine max]